MVYLLQERLKILKLVSFILLPMIYFIPINVQKKMTPKLSAIFLKKYPASAYDHRMNRLIPEEEQRIHRLITHEYTLKDLASYALRHITHPKDVYNLGWGLNEDLFAIFKKIYPHTFKKNPFRKIEFL